MVCIKTKSGVISFDGKEIDYTNVRCLLEVDASEKGLKTFEEWYEDGGKRFLRALRRAISLEKIEDQF